MKEQFKNVRKALITKIKGLTDKRQALKGVSGTSAEWKELTSEINTIQEQIDRINRAMGNTIYAASRQAPTKAKVLKNANHQRSESEISDIYIAG